ncbi:hypothetical protein G7Z17_g5695 [Cylindrodendrum hubeiense]|uniref:CENP-V/GFA domain-containing protein n=1 Tax=Cylindrodendrum hubeiense TaxID=595255 RepID=A0A9P5HDN3_9HYPO|nr:hypothetical protein G7Z17_g5695 [Cylindrodendrum hubeiense]
MTTHYSEKKDLLPLTGGCACGLIRYQLTQPPILVHCCYCTACQRQTGSAFALNAIIESTALVQLPSASPSVAGNPAAPEPVCAGLMPAFANATDSVSTTHEQPDPDSKPAPAPVCIPTQSGLGQTVAHCPSCHVGLWNFYADGGPHVSYIRVGTLDRPWEIEPDVHIYTRSRMAFLAVNDGKPQFEEYYPSRDALVQGDALERLQALKPVVRNWWVDLKAALSSQ